MNTADWKHNPRLYYIKSIQAHTPNTCPDCGMELTTDHEQVYCTNGGLICLDSITYSAGRKHNLPYGLKLG